MTKTISFDLSKRLDELWLLRDVETEYVFQEWIKSTIWKWTIIFSWDWIFKIKSIKELHKWWYIFYKTLTTDEAIEFLPEWFWLKKIDWRYLFLFYRKCEYRVWEENLINWIENFIKFLLDNKLIWPTNKN